jgi:hypothetical protein
MKNRKALMDQRLIQWVDYHTRIWHEDIHFLLPKRIIDFTDF